MALILGNKLANVLIGTKLADTISGNDGDDVLTGLAGNDILNGGSGADTIIGGDGDDVLTGQAGDDILSGGTGADILNGGTGFDSMAGGSGNDDYFVDSVLDSIFEAPNAGIDRVFSWTSFTLSTVGRGDVEDLTLMGVGGIGGAGNGLGNRITGNSASNFLNGLGGDDRLLGLGGNDNLTGGNGADVLDGGFGIDKMHGEAGNDTYFVDNAGDVVIELPGSGIDKISSSISTSLNVGTRYNVEGLTLTGQAVVGTGNALANTISGNAVGNVLSGLEGGDYIFGWGGDDTLVGGAGNDVLNGWTGADTIAAGGGFDTIVFSAALGGNIDRVLDFNPAYDIFNLKNTAFTGLTAKTVLSADAFHLGAAAADAEDRIIYNSADGKLFFDPDGTGATAQIQFATLAAGLGLTNGDFYVV